MKTIIIFGLFLFFGINTNAQCWESANNDGYFMSTGIKTDGTLWAWGYSTPINNVNTDHPIQVGTDANWHSVSTGWYMRAAIKDNGTLWTWGYNYSGTLGNGLSNSSYVSAPTQVGTSSDWVSVDCTGGAHCLGIKQDNSLWVWGFNYYGALGLGAISNDVLVPTRIGTGNDWQMATVTHIVNNGYGNSSSFAIKTNGTLWGWGYNGSGQLGDGTLINKNIPTLVNASTDWVSVRSAWGSTFALKSNGTLWATGSNYLGRLGDGTQINKTVFTQIGTSNWQSVAIGRYHSLGIKTDGTLWAWGDNTGCGAFGTGNDIDSLFPIQVGAENDWKSVSINIALSAGPSQALKTNGTLWAWGCNSYGALGIGPVSGGIRSYPGQVGCNGLGTETFSNSKITIFPNPVREIINIKNLENEIIIKKMIYDVAGKRVVEINNDDSQINVEQFEKGVYLIQVFTENGIHQQKFIKL